MSLELSDKTIVKSYHERSVNIGDIELSTEDVLSIAFYALTNTDLVEGDPRLGFLRILQAMEVVEGYNAGSKRLDVEGVLSPWPPDWRTEARKAK